MTGKEDLSYRKITENIAGKLDLLEAYLFYCLALCSDCYTMVSDVKQETLTEFYGIKKEEQIRLWLHKFGLESDSDRQASNSRQIWTF